MCGKHNNDSNLCFLILLILLLQCYGGENSIPMNLLSEAMGIGSFGGGPVEEEPVEDIRGNYGNNYGYGNGCCRCRCCGC